jgi:hypothetical protein
MRLVLLSFVLFMGITPVIFAQNVASEENENYKHVNTIHQHNTSTFESDTISMRNQKTNKQYSGKYIVAPSDSLPSRNVQGKKTKANYKNQFN